MAYIDNDDVKARFFRGNTVPGINTIDASTNTSYITTTTNIVNGQILGVSSDITDTYGLLKEMALIIYGRLLNHEYPLLDEGTSKNPGKDYDLIMSIRVKSGTLPIAVIRPSDNWSVQNTGTGSG